MSVAHNLFGRPHSRRCGFSDFPLDVPRGAEDFPFDFTQDDEASPINPTQYIEQHRPLPSRGRGGDDDHLNYVPSDTGEENQEDRGREEDEEHAEDEEQDYMVPSV
ncbi:hypothetical protein AC578_6578 [Pseudocercospora eumusae]|uniref:Uncharacterized protein n=1 Tax=Pseudocercospora eumusae TaxID=321146 RepID=A0A139HHU6_9PEZI|nr:hypothetical protein AC578_6578 [Pseudocercospora eumusae]